MKRMITFTSAAARRIAPASGGPSFAEGGGTGLSESVSAVTQARSDGAASVGDAPLTPMSARSFGARGMRRNSRNSSQRPIRGSARRGSASSSVLKQDASMARRMPSNLSTMGSEASLMSITSTTRGAGDFDHSLQDVAALHAMPRVVPNRWRAIIAAVVLYYITTMPIRMSRFRHAPDMLFDFIVFDVVADILCIIDIFLRFRSVPRTVFNRLDNREARRYGFYYLRQEFAFDICAAVPLDVFVFVVGRDWLPFLRVNKLLRMAHLPALWTELGAYLEEHDVFVNARVWRLYRILLTLFYFIHCVTCLWIAVAHGSIECEGDSLYRYEHMHCFSERENWLETDGCVNCKFWDKYARSLYTTSSTMITVGFGDIVPQTTYETLFIISVCVGGMILATQVIASFSAIFSSLTMMEAQYFNKVSIIERYLKSKRIPQEIRDRASGYFDHLWHTQRGVEENRVLAALPTHLRIDVLKFLEGDAISKIPFLAQRFDRNSGLINSLIMVLHPVLFSPLAFVYTKGQAGDEMLVVNRGLCGRVSDVEADKHLEGGAKGGGADDDAVLKATLGGGIGGVERSKSSRLLKQAYTYKPGDFFGEMCLFSDAQRTETVQAQTFCELFVLSRSDFTHITSIWFGAKASDELDAMQEIAQRTKAQRALLHRRPSDVEISDRLDSMRRRRHAWGGWMSNGMFRNAWQVLGLVVLLYGVLWLPLRVAFLQDDFALLWESDSVRSERSAHPIIVRWLIAGDIISDLYYWVDIFFRCRYFSHMETDWNLLASVSPRVIFLNYRAGPFGFWYDLSSNLPLDFVFAIYFGWGYFSFGRILRLWRLSYIFVYMSSVSLLFQKGFGIRFSWRSVQAKFAVIFVVCIAVIHYIGCMWYYMGWVAEDLSEGWSPSPPSPSATSRFLFRNGTNEAGRFTWIDNDLLHGTGLNQQYFRSIYYALVAITTTGYGDIRAYTIGESFLSAAAVCFGGIFYFAMIGLIASIISNANIAYNKFQARIDMVNAYMRQLDVGLSLSRRIRSYYRYLWRRQMGVRESKILSYLPSTIRNSVELYLNPPVMQRMRIFQDVSTAFIKRLAPEFKFAVYLPQDVVISFNGRADFMFILNQGRMQVLSEHYDETHAFLDCTDHVDALGVETRKRGSGGQSSVVEAPWWRKVILCECVRQRSRKQRLRVMFDKEKEADEKNFPKHLTSRMWLNTANSFSAVYGEAAIAGALTDGGIRSWGENVQALTFSDVSLLSLASLSAVMRSFPSDSRAIKSNCVDISAWEQKHCAAVQDNLKLRPKVRRVISTQYRSRPRRMLPWQPNGLSQISWNMVVMTIVLYQLIVVPLRVAFPSINSVEWYYVDYALDTVFYVDIYLRFTRFAYMRSDGAVVLDNGAIRKNFIRTTFIWDVLASAPWDAVALFAYLHGDGVKGNLLLEWMALCRLPKLIRCYRVPSYTAQLRSLVQEQNCRINSNVISLVQLFVGVLLVAHWLACIFVWIADVQVSTESWLTEQPSLQFAGDTSANLVDDSTPFIYLRAFYYSIATLTVVCHGDIVPVSLEDTVFGIFVMVLSFFLVSILLGNIVNLILNMDLAASALNNQLSRFDKYASRHVIPSDLVSRVHKYLNRHFEIHHGMDYIGIHQDLPRTLRQDLAVRRNFKLIHGMDMGKSQRLDSSILRSLSDICILRLFIPKDIIIRAGSVGTTMFVIDNGMVDVMLWHMDVDSYDDDDEVEDVKTKNLGYTLVKKPAVRRSFVSKHRVRRRSMLRHVKHNLDVAASTDRGGDSSDSEDPSMASSRRSSNASSVNGAASEWMTRKKGMGARKLSLDAFKSAANRVQKKSVKMRDMAQAQNLSGFKLVAMRLMQRKKEQENQKISDFKDLAMRLIQDRRVTKGRLLQRGANMGRIEETGESSKIIRSHAAQVSQDLDRILGRPPKRITNRAKPVPAQVGKDILTRLHAGATFGEVSFFLPVPRMATVKSVGVSECLVFEKKDFMLLFDKASESIEDMKRYARSEQVIISTVNRSVQKNLSQRGKLRWFFGHGAPLAPMGSAKGSQPGVSDKKMEKRLSLRERRLSASQQRKRQGSVSTLIRGLETAGVDVGAGGVGRRAVASSSSKMRSTQIHRRRMSRMLGTTSRPKVLSKLRGAGSSSSAIQNAAGSNDARIHPLVRRKSEALLKAHTSDIRTVKFPHIWLPSSRLYRTWSGCMVILTIYLLLCTPWRAAFMEPDPGLHDAARWWVFVDYALEAFYFADMYLRLKHFATFSEEIALDRKSLHKREIDLRGISSGRHDSYYWSRSFCIDSAALVPVDLLAVVFSGSVKSMVYLRLVKLLRVFFVFNVFSELNASYRWQRKLEALKRVRELARLKKKRAESVSGQQTQNFGIRRSVVPLRSGSGIRKGSLVGTSKQSKHDSDTPSVIKDLAEAVADIASDGTSHATTSDGAYFLWRQISFVVIFMVVAHFLACLWTFVGFNSDSYNWLVVDGHVDGATGAVLQSPFVMYVRGVHYIVVSMSTVGYGDITNVNWIENLFSIFLIVVSTGMFNGLIATFETSFRDVDSDVSDYQTNMKINRHYLKSRHLSLGLQERINLYYQFLWDRSKGIDEASVLEPLPFQVQEDIKMHINRGIIESVPFFSECEPSFIKSIAAVLRAQLFVPRDYIVRSGMINSQMYFIKRGTVLERDRGVEKKDTGTIRLRAGDFFGEGSLLKDLCMRTDYIAVSFCDIFSLERQDFNVILAYFPQYQFGSLIAKMKSVSNRRHWNLGAKKTGEQEALLSVANGAVRFSERTVLEMEREAKEEEEERTRVKAALELAAKGGTQRGRGASMMLGKGGDEENNVIDAEEAKAKAEAAAAAVKATESAAAEKKKAREEANKKAHLERRKKIRERKTHRHNLSSIISPVDSLIEARTLSDVVHEAARAKRDAQLSGVAIVESAEDEKGGAKDKGRKVASKFFSRVSSTMMYNFIVNLTRLNEMEKKEAAEQQVSDDIPADATVSSPLTVNKDGSTTLITEEDRGRAVQRMRAGTEKILIVDVRDRNDYHRDHVTGSVNAPVFEDDVSVMPSRNKPTIGLEGVLDRITSLKERSSINDSVDASVIVVDADGRSKVGKHVAKLFVDGEVLSSETRAPRDVLLLAGGVDRLSERFPFMLCHVSDRELDSAEYHQASLVHTHSVAGIGCPNEIVEDFLYLGSRDNALGRSMLLRLGMTAVLVATKEVVADSKSFLSRFCRVPLPDEYFMDALVVQQLGVTLEHVDEGSEESDSSRSVSRSRSKTDADGTVSRRNGDGDEEKSYVDPFDPIYDEYSQWFEDALEFLDNIRAHEGRVIVCCESGDDRSAVICMVWLMHAKKMSLKAAYDIVRKARPSVQIHALLWRMLSEFERGGAAMFDTVDDCEDVCKLEEECEARLAEKERARLENKDEIKATAVKEAPVMKRVKTFMRRVSSRRASEATVDKLAALIAEAESQDMQILPGFNSHGKKLITSETS